MSQTIEGLPVPGYRPQSAESVAIVTAMKITEEKLLRALDDLAAREDVDKRWLAIGRTQIEQGFMAVNRSIFRPARLRLEASERPDDPPVDDRQRGRPEAQAEGGDGGR